MTLYSKRQTKKTLGLENFKGITVLNKPKDKGFEVKFRAEVSDPSNGKMQKESFATANEAAAYANKFFKAIYGDAKSAKKAGFWNKI